MKQAIYRKILLIYKLTASPIVSALGGRCRYYPSCSEYAKEAFEQHSFLRAVSLIVKRLLKCAPWTAGGIDFVPPR